MGEMIIYQTEAYERKIGARDYRERFVDTQTFLGYCRSCPNHNRYWSCPEYDFDIYSRWNGYQTLELHAVKIIFDPEDLESLRGSEDAHARLFEALTVEKRKLADKLLRLEVGFPGSRAVLAGNCAICGAGACAREQRQDCRHPEQMRESLEAHGGDVTKTAAELFDTPIDWVTGNNLPRYFFLVCGLLKDPL
jgi:predicted metal-binding protein